MRESEKGSALVNDDAADLDGVFESLREQFEAENPICASEFGDWLTRMDGTSEARTLIGESAEGFHAGVEFSYGGGDGPVYWSEPYPARELARSNLSDWYRRCRDEHDH